MGMKKNEKLLKEKIDSLQSSNSSMKEDNLKLLQIIEKLEMKLNKSAEQEKAYREAKEVNKSLIKSLKNEILSLQTQMKQVEEKNQEKLRKIDEKIRKTIENKDEEIKSLNFHIQVLSEKNHQIEETLKELY